MDIKDFIELIANQFVNTEQSEFKAETRLQELDEYSSLIALFIISEVFEKYRVSLKSTDLMASDTIQDLFNIVEANKK